MVTGLITQLFIVCFLFLSYFPTTLLAFPGITSQISYLYSNPVSEPALVEPKIRHILLEMSGMQLDMNLEFRREVWATWESWAKGGICSVYLLLHGKITPRFSD